MGGKLIGGIVAILGIVALVVIIIVAMRSQSPDPGPVVAVSQSAPGSQPATVASSSPSTAPAGLSEVHRAVAAYLDGQLSTDLKATVATLDFPAHVREFVEATIAGEYARVRAERVLDETFPEENSWLKKRSADLRQRIAELPRAELKVDDGAASLTSGAHPIHLTRVDGVWKIDYLKTEELNPEDASMDLIHEEPKMYDELIADLKAGSFKSRQEFHNEELRRRQTIGR